MKNLLEQTGRTAFRLIFIDFDGESSFHESELGPIPAGWTVAPLGDYLSVVETGKRPKGGIKGVDSGIPSLGAEHVNGVGVFDFAKVKYVPRYFFDSMRRGILQDGDVLLYKDGGKPGQFEPHVSMVGQGFPFDEMCINEHVYRLRAKPPLTQAYLYFWLTSPFALEEMRRRGTGVAIPGLNSTAVKGMPVLVPSPEAIDRFESLGDPLTRRILLAARTA